MMGSEYNRTGMRAAERKARPLEAFCIGLSRDRFAFSGILDILHGSETARVEVDPQGTLAAKCRAEIAKIDQKLDSRAEALANERRQFVRAEREKDEWASPSARGAGWLCPSSPTGICISQNMDYEECDYCGHPEERK